jgi:hypothetical protein
MEDSLSAKLKSPLFRGLFNLWLEEGENPNRVRLNAHAFWTHAGRPAGVDKSLLGPLTITKCARILDAAGGPQD